MINLTQHKATPEQVAAGVVEPSAEDKQVICDLLTFNTVPTRDEIERRAFALALFAQALGARAAMIGGAPYLMSALEAALREQGITPYYAFSVRDVVEKDGVKVSCFRHAGFVEG